RLLDTRPRDTVETLDIRPRSVRRRKTIEDVRHESQVMAPKNLHRGPAAQTERRLARRRISPNRQPQLRSGHDDGAIHEGARLARSSPTSAHAHGKSRCQEGDDGNGAAGHEPSIAPPEAPIHGHAMGGRWNARPARS